jgi:Big-like domain-containing protein
MRTLLRALLVVLALAFPGAALAGTSAGQPFPSNLYTTPDHSQITGLRVDLQKPDCTQQPSRCNDVTVIDTLDGFNIQPRISVPFSGPIDLSTVSSHTIFLVGPRGHVVGINQVVWEPAANTLHFESDQQLDQDSTYLLVVTRGVHDATGHPLDPLSLSALWRSAPPAYRVDLLRAIPAAFVAGVDPGNVAAASVFTTQSITAISEKIRHQLRGSDVNFNLGTHGERTVFAVTPGLSAFLNRQNGPTLSPPSPLLLPALGGAVGTLAFGTYSSPDYETADEVIPAVGTRTGTPQVQSVNQLQFTLFLPAGTEPDHGWPVAIFGHGFTDSKDGAPWAVAGTFARNGIATIAINVVGHGGGPGGTYTITPPGSASVTLPSGGRAVDQNGDGNFDSTEGVNAVGANSIVAGRDGLRQTTIDLMQLVRVLERGVDVNGDGRPDLSRKLIYYAGQSFGGIYGVQLLGLEPDIRAGVPNVPGGPIVEIARLSPSFRPLVGISLLTYVPTLYNTFPPDPLVSNFRENIPLRNLPILVDTIPGASAIQSYIDDSEWVQQAGNPAAYAPYIQRPVIIQFARGDQTVPNPTTSAILRAGNLADRATLFRNDLAHADFGTSKNPHTFLTNIVGPGATFAFEAQQQMATFFTSDGKTIVDPDGAGKYFETPTSIVPEDLDFIP